MHQLEVIVRERRIGRSYADHPREQPHAQDETETASIYRLKHWIATAVTHMRIDERVRLWPLGHLG